MRGARTGLYVNSSRAEDNEGPVNKVDGPVEDHIIALSILFSRIIFLMRSAILVKSVQKNNRTMIVVIGIAISQNLR